MKRMFLMTLTLSMILSGCVSQVSQSASMISNKQKILVAPIFQLSDSSSEINEYDGDLNKKTSFTIPSPGVNSLVVNKDTLYGTTNDGIFQCDQSGEIQRMLKIKDTPRFINRLGNQLVVLAVGNGIKGEVILIDLFTFKITKNLTIDGLGEGVYSAGKNIATVLSYDTQKKASNIYIINTEGNITNHTSSSNQFITDIVMDNDALYDVSTDTETQKSSFEKFDITTLRKLKVTNLPAHAYRIAQNHNNFYISHFDLVERSGNTISVISKSTDTVVDTLTMKHDVLSLTADDNFIYTSSINDKMLTRFYSNSKVQKSIETEQKQYQLNLNLYIL
jgi:hypothetical protein